MLVILFLVSYLGGWSFDDATLASQTLFVTTNLQTQCTWTSVVRRSVVDAFTLKQCSTVHQNTSFSVEKLRKIPHPLGAEL